MASDPDRHRIRIPELVLPDLSGEVRDFDAEVAEARASEMTPDERAYLEREVAAFRQASADRIEGLVEGARQEHAEAVRICGEHNEHGQRFALFLRSFSVEATVREARGDELEYASQFRSVNPHRPVEERFVAWLAEWLAVVAVANPFDPAPRRDVPHLHVSADEWKGVVDDLLEAAYVVVMQLESASAGVSYELDAILRAKKERRTVVILSEPWGDPLFADAPERLTPDDPLVQRFPRVVTEEELRSVDDDPGRLPALAGLFK